MKKRYVGIDVFRIICYLVVCAFHTTFHLGCSYKWLTEVSSMGAVFMTAFFMMSGYVLFLNYNNINLINIKNIKNFAIKRLIGIVPMYYISAIIFILVRGEETLKQNILLAPIEMLGIQSTFTSLFSFTHNGGTWFISCIIICYIIYPYIQEILKQISIKHKIFVFILITGILIYAPVIVDKFNTASIYSNPFFRGLEFILGITLASMMEEILAKKVLQKILCNWIAIIVEFLVFILAVTICVKKEFHVGDYMYYSFIGIPIFTCMFISFSGAKMDLIDNSRIIKYLSSLAYPFFLAQLFSNWICLDIIDKYGITSNVKKIVLGWSICIVIAILLHELIEKPMTKILKRKLINSKQEN